MEEWAGITTLEPCGKKSIHNSHRWGLFDNIWCDGRATDE